MKNAIGPERTVESVDFASSWESEELGPPLGWERVVLFLLRLRPIQRAFNRRIGDAYLVYNEDGSLKDTDYSSSDHEADALDLLDLFGNYARIEGARVLDVGCGDGSKSEVVASLGAEEVVGIDTDPMRITRAHERATTSGIANLRFAAVQEDRFPVGDAEFDIVLLLNVMEHVDRPARVLDECRRALKSGGVVLNVFKTWKSPRGSHINDWVYIPWNHLLFPERDLVRVLKRMSKENPFIKYNYPALANHPLPRDLVALADGGLNRMTLRQYLTYLENSRLHVDHLTLTGYGYRSNHWFIRLFRHLTTLPIIREYLGGWVVTVLRRSES
jgi:ubiquinone/menaquinone biosynthesis C-methylase UbiE